MSLKYDPKITFWNTLKPPNSDQLSTSGVGNSFDFAGHIRDNLGIRGPVNVQVSWIQVYLDVLYAFMGNIAI